MADRRKLGTKDMVLTMIVVLVVVGFIALFGGGFRFAPGTKPVRGSIPTADVIGGFTEASQTLTFPVTVPRGVPGSWHPNSLAITTPKSGKSVTLPTVRGGWVTPDGAFITLIESSGRPSQVLTAEVGSAGPAHGTKQAGGVTWTVTDGVRNEAAWIRTSGQTTFLITGSAPERDFVTLAEAVSAG